MFTVERYRKTRFWAVYEAGDLLCVTVYKKGAHAVKERLERGLTSAAAPATALRTRNWRTSTFVSIAGGDRHG